jgi:hypothetical protein
VTELPQEPRVVKLAAILNSLNQDSAVNFVTWGERETLNRAEGATMNYPAASCGVSEYADKTSSSGVTPECFYRGSSLPVRCTQTGPKFACGEPSRTTAKGMRE